ncbi:MAG TPA: DUF5683 domain-containing protein [Puia sp.]|jgi:hypothetical protein
MRQVFFFLLLLTGSFLNQAAYGQHTDSLPARPATDTILHPVADTVRKKADSIPVRSGILPDSVQHKKDSVTKKKHDPRRATIYSAILPGAGQIYNHKYWKLPIVYAAIGIPVYTFFYNRSWYKKCQYALAVAVSQSQGDSLARVDPQLVNFVKAGDVNDIITYRDSFRKSQDYSVLYFLLFYGLNIVDATVDAHLRDFNVNSDLSFKVKPMLIPGPNMVAGFSVVFDFHKGRPRSLNMN